MLRIWPTQSMETPIMWTNNGPALWLTEDKSTIVPAGDSAARWQLVCEGGQIPIEEAERYGLTSGTKAKGAPANKLKAAKGANKDAPPGDTPPTEDAPSGADTPPPAGDPGAGATAGGEPPKE